jgi:hypothetical protein
MARSTDQALCRPMHFDWPGLQRTVESTPTCPNGWVRRTSAETATSHRPYIYTAPRWDRRAVRGILIEEHASSCRSGWPASGRRADYCRMRMITPKSRCSDVQASRARRAMRNERSATTRYANTRSGSAGHFVGARMRSERTLTVRRLGDNKTSISLDDIVC